MCMPTLVNGLELTLPTGVSFRIIPALAAIRKKTMTSYLTTKEVADLLRLKERKVYDLAASGDIPCTRATGKLLFQRESIEQWLVNNTTGVAAQGGAKVAPLPLVLLGSHDPLLEWALRQSKCGLASILDSSREGLHRLARGEGALVGLHLPGDSAQSWNVETIAGQPWSRDCVLIEWAWRKRGLLVPSSLEQRVKRLQHLKGLRLVPRQPEAGSQALLEQLLNAEGLPAKDVEMLEPVRSESDAAELVVSGKGDAAFGLEVHAAQHQLAFIPIADERFDLLIDRRAYFEAPVQQFLAFCRSDAFRAKAAELPGYDVSGQGRVHFTGPGG